MFSENPKSKFWSDRNEKKSNEVALNSCTGVNSIIWLNVFFKYKNSFKL